MTGACIRVAVDCPLRSALDYLAPGGTTAAPPEPGMRVLVPLGRRQAQGIVLGESAGSTLPQARLRPIAAVLDDAPLVDAQMRSLLEWTAAYYHHPVGEVFAAALPAALRAGQPLEERETCLALTPAGAEANAAGEPARAPRQRALLQLLAAGPAAGLSREAITGRLPGWQAAARELEQRGWLVREERSRAPAAPAPTQGQPPRGAQPAPPIPSAEQAAAIEAVGSHLGGFGVFLLQGATGSGKTEVYLQLAARALRRGGSVLVLVPEIGLTPQLVERFRTRLDAGIAVLHSALGDGERLAAWRAARSGAARVVIGTRSAVFAPLTGLGLVIVDEEHDASYKQQEGGCRYSARDLAVRRAQLAGVPVLLGSATPSLESLRNAAQGRYRRLLLPRRPDQAPPPRIALIDLRAHAVHAGLAGPVTQAIARHLEGDGQVLVYINRRGYAPTLMCTSCGWIAPCLECDARLTVHQGARELRCHYCGARHALPQRCGRCGFAVRPVGQGTERIAETLVQMFPHAPLLRLDRDSARGPEDVEAVMNALLDRSARILVGTQMVTKGHHFPGVTLVAVVNADQGLFSTDFRAAERLAQTIVQVAGRAGREERAGEVLIQTDHPGHPLLQQLVHQGYEGFAASALAEREAARWPPYSRLALLRASAPTPGGAMEFLTAARVAAGERPAARLLGPAPATMARRAGRHHAQLLVEHASRPGLQAFLDDWVPRVGELREARRVRWALDVDPLET